VAVTQRGMSHEAVEPVGKGGRKSPMERVVESLASGLGNSVAFMAEYGILFVTFAVLWLAFGAGLIWSQGSVDAAWRWIGDMPLLLQVVVWLLFLPVMVGMWIWQTTWPLALRLLLIVGIGGWNLMVFLPRALTTGRP
jgi:hypothetical protein